ncbi:hypothetical protein NEUTE1DRAFT_142693 [Neurospora tetrasperma FGSC 2508]|uniref:Uncharacterized protein n=1 Tax=Neurospora tetrasperma (strain FGSC 2508 / ATCC MYA-4615 / P0657) TaxID=510951 RepID=F8MZF2_NEUT8|nr:uncharacterized protein NEUTE1DRAFT_142693 [Neurospora tetrasperma FGSC 2508]EGO52842.1 hypothetical protein NEUTE1DRAFT_142693 [Neurospora tetrasperma FGSC 2508]
MPVLETRVYNPGASPITIIPSAAATAATTPARINPSKYKIASPSLTNLTYIKEKEE